MRYTKVGDEEELVGDELNMIKLHCKNDLNNQIRNKNMIF